jgi:predicted MFS family arabinose efflux permease
VVVARGEGGSGAWQGPRAARPVRQFRMLRPVLTAYREAFSGLPRATWVLAAVCLVHRAGTMVLPFLALYLTARRGMTPGEAGLVLSLYGIGSGVGAFWGGRLTDRFGPRHVQMASLVLAGLGFLLLGQLDRPGTIRAAALLLATAAEAFRPANSVAFANAVEPGRWSQAFALRRLAINLGMTCGPALGGVLAARDYGLLFLVDGGTCLAAGALLAALYRPAAPTLAERSRTGGRSPWRDGPFLGLLLACTTFAAVLYQFFATYPLALRDLHRMPEPQIGSVYAINTVLIVLVEMVLVRQLSRRRPLAVAAWGGLLFCGGFALLPFGHGYAFVAATVVVWTVGEMLTMPFLETVVASRGDERSRGSYLGSYNFAFSVAFAGAPLLGMALYERVGPRILFAGCGLLGIVLWLGLRALARWLEPAAAGAADDAATPASPAPPLAPAAAAAAATTAPEPRAR